MLEMLRKLKWFLLLGKWKSLTVVVYLLSLYLWPVLHFTSSLPPISSADAVLVTTRCYKLPWMVDTRISFDGILWLSHFCICIDCSVCCLFALVFQYDSSCFRNLIEEMVTEDERRRNTLKENIEIYKSKLSTLCAELGVAPIQVCFLFLLLFYRNAVYNLYAMFIYLNKLSNWRVC